MRLWFSRVKGASTCGAVRIELTPYMILSRMFYYAIYVIDVSDTTPLQAYSFSFFEFKHGVLYHLRGLNLFLSPEPGIESNIIKGIIINLTS